MLYIIRGLPGAGKSTLGCALAADACYAADDFFEVDSIYNFDPSRLAEAHAACQENTQRALSDGLPVAVANTFTQRWEMEPYLRMADERGCRVTVIDLYDGGLNDQELHDTGTHDVPLQTIQAMRERYEHDWKNGNTLPPWVEAP